MVDQEQAPVLPKPIGPEGGGLAFLYLSVFLFPCALIAIFLFSQSSIGIPELRNAIRWFDSFFFLYNICLAMFATAIVPLVTYFYVRTMREEKVRRLKRDLREAWRECAEEVTSLIHQQFRFRNYLGSLLAVMLVISSGVFIILLLKPYIPLVGAGKTVIYSPTLGVDYSKGANILLLGPTIEYYQDPLHQKEYYHQIIIALTAFQFGFLGAYVYFIGQLLRSYFTLDLSPHTHVAGAIRMTTSSVLALVLSFALPGLGAAASASEPGGMVHLLPAIAFFLGYFPNRALLWLQMLGNKVLGLGRQQYAETPLARLSGMSSSHEARLEREGFDNLETLSHADPIQLAVRTGFSYQQVKYWISEARLRVQLGEKDFDEFVRQSWLHTEDELRQLGGEFKEVVCGCVALEMRARLGLVLLLLTRRSEGDPGSSAC